MPVLDAQELTKTLGTRTLLQGVNLTIARGEKVGLVGDNGAGKSTLARILAGKLEADQGQINRRKGSQVAYLEQDPSFPDGITAGAAALSGLTSWQKYKNRYDELCAELADPALSEAKLEELLAAQEDVTKHIEHLGGWGRHDEAERILRTLGIGDPNQLLATMSGGERRRVALAALLIQAPDLAILDEPTNHLDADTIEWLEEYLTNVFAGALLLITHDRFLLNRVVTRTLEVENGQVFSYSGGWEDYLIGREERNALKERTEANRQNFLRREIEWLRRQPKARTGKQKARIKRAESAISAAPDAKTKSLTLGIEEQRLGGTIIEARGVAVKIADRELVHPFDLHLTKGMRLGIVGHSGAGKTTLLRTLLGEIPCGAGEVIRGKNTKISYLDQSRTGLNEEDTVFDAITDGRPSVQVGTNEYSSYSYLERFGFRGEAIRQKVAGLSGGERARVALARLLLSTANVLVLDEPTNDLDVMTLSALEELIQSLQGVALIVTHDRYFLDRVATATLAIDRHRQAHLIQGGFTNYAEFRKEYERRRKLLEEERLASQKANDAPPARPSASKKKLSYGEEIELSGLMERIETLSAQVAALEEQLSDPSLHTERRDEAASIQTELELRRNELEETEMRWLELEERKQS